MPPYISSELSELPTSSIYQTELPSSPPPNLSDATDSDTDSSQTDSTSTPTKRVTSRKRAGTQTQRGQSSTKRRNTQRTSPKEKLYQERASQDIIRAVYRQLKNHNTSLKGMFRTVLDDPKAQTSRRAFKEALLDNQSKFGDRVVIEYLKKFGWEPACKVLRKELGEFCKTFLHGKDDIQVDPSLVNSDGPNWLQQMTSTQQLEEVAPSLCTILMKITKVARESKNRQGTSGVWLGGTISHLGFRMQPKSGARMARNLGMLLYNCNITRRGLEILHSLGVVCSYATVNRAVKRLMKTHTELVHTLGQSLQRIIVYDNFNVTDHVRDVRIGDETKMWNVTTGLVKICRHIPPTGIPREWYHPHKPLLVKQIEPLDPATRIRNLNLNKQLWHFYITQAMCLCFPNLRERLLIQQEENQCTSNISHPVQLDLPVLERPIDHSPSFIVPLGPLMFNEATEVGNAEILEDIHERQFALKVTDSQFSESLFIHFGDAMTTSRLHSLKQNRSICDSAYGRLDWVLVMFGLWHLRLNMQRLILKHHFGDETDDHASLWYAWHSAYVNRKFEDKVFEQCHRLITQSFYARLIAVMRHIISRQFTPEEHDIPTPDTSPRSDTICIDHEKPDQSWYREHVEGWIETQSIQDVGDLITQVYNTIDIHSRHRTKPIDEHDTLGQTGLPTQAYPVNDHEFANHLHFLANVFPYLLLSDAIKVSDLGLLRHASREALLLFAGSTENYLYTRELCYFYWLTSTPAADLSLQKILLRESLVNRQGRLDTYYEMDRANELLNLHLRIVKLSRRSSSIRVDVLMSRYTSIYTYQNQLREMFEDTLGVKPNNIHQQKPLNTHLWLLAGNLLQAQNGTTPSIVEDTRGRVSNRLTPLLAQQGRKRLSKVVADFNRWRTNADIGDVDDDGNRVNDDHIREAALIQQQLLARYRREKDAAPQEQLPNNPPPQYHNEDTTQDTSLLVEPLLGSPQTELDFDIGDDENMILIQPTLTNESPRDNASDPIDIGEDFDTESSQASTSHNDSIQDGDPDNEELGISESGDE